MSFPCDGIETAVGQAAASGSAQCWSCQPNIVTEAVIPMSSTTSTLERKSYGPVRLDVPLLTCWCGQDLLAASAHHCPRCGRAYATNSRAVPLNQTA